MKIIIDIPETAYRLLNNGGVDWLGTEYILSAVAKGTPLPKEHGRIVDIGPYEGKVIVSRIYCGVNNPVEVAELDTIIEAESEEKNEI